MNPEEATTQAVLDYLSSAPGSLFAGQTVRVREHWVGADNLLWRVEADNGERCVDAVAKLYLDAGWVRGRRQHDAHTAFHGVCLAPRPLWFDREPEGLSRQVVLYHYVDGRAPASSDGAAMDAIAEAIAAVHTSAVPLGRMAPHPLTLTTYGEMLEASVRGLRARLSEGGRVEARAAFDRLAQAAQRLVADALPQWQGASPVPVHGDLKLENVVVNAEGVTLLDWELCGLGDPALEVARFLVLTPFATEDSRARWLGAYLRRAPCPGLKERIALYGRLLPFDALCALLDGTRTHSAALNEAERADLAILIGAVGTRAADALGVSEFDMPGIQALLRPLA